MKGQLTPGAGSNRPKTNFVLSASTEFHLLTDQQTAAKDAAHRRFDFPLSAAAQERGNVIHEEELPRFTRGVEGIGVAEEVIRIYVLEGHEEAVDIPSKLEGLRTERVSTSGFGILAPKQQITKTPVPCGVSIGHYNITAGTLGCLVEASGTVCILSNNHVLADTNNGVVGDDILQPGPCDQPP